MALTPEQEARLRQRGHQAVFGLENTLLGRADELVALAVERAGSVGAQDYGDASYRKTHTQVGVDVDEELADAIFYEHLRW